MPTEAEQSQIQQKEEILTKTDGHPTPTVEEVKPAEKSKHPEEKKEVFKKFDMSK